MDHVVGDDGWVHDQGRNPWRPLQGDPAVIEVLLPASGAISLIDVDHHTRIAPHYWYRDTEGYAAAHVGPDDKVERMHTFLFPLIQPPRDHINRHKCDNRSANIRTGANGINNRNSRLMDGGVFPHHGRRAYVAVWSGIDGKKCNKLFPWKNYADATAAKAAAIQHRAVEAKKVEDRILALQTERDNGIALIERHVPTPKISNLRERGLSIRRAGTSSAYVHACTVINQETHETTFLISRFADLEAAKDAARDWLTATKAAHPKLPKKKRRKLADQ